MLPGVDAYLELAGLGLIVGMYGTLIGAGGGFVLMPLLILLYPSDQPELLTSISLAVVFFNALSGSEAYALMKRIDYKSGALFAAATIPGAILGALNTGYLPRRTFDIVFGGILLLAAAFIIIRPKRDQPHHAGVSHGKITMTRHLVDARGARYDYTFNPILGLVLSVLAGYMSSFLGIGGGIIHVPVLTFFLNFPVHVATATSHFILAAMALAGTLVHLFNGTFAHGVHRTIGLAIGVMIGAQIGAHLSNRLKGAWIVRSLALALAAAALRILSVSIQQSQGRRLRARRSGLT